MLFGVRVPLQIQSRGHAATYKAIAGAEAAGADADADDDAMSDKIDVEVQAEL